jgi:CheY-like chemotaxis protein
MRLGPTAGDSGIMSTVPSILVVENEALIRMELVHTLVAGGYTVSECGDGASAMAQIDASHDLQGLISDIRLGKGPDGWEVAHHARRKFPNLAVVYVTGDNFSNWSAEGVPKSLILQKPYAEAQLMNAISGLLTDAVPQRLGNGQSDD